jgi:hypothetical protein
MRPEQTLDIKLAFAGWFASKPAAELAEMEADAYANQGFSNSPQDELDSLRVAQNYWVAPDMVRIAEAAQETLPDEDVLLEEPPQVMDSSCSLSPSRFGAPIRSVWMTIRSADCGGGPSTESFPLPSGPRNSTMTESLSNGSDLSLAKRIVSSSDRLSLRWGTGCSCPRVALSRWLSR